MKRLARLLLLLAACSGGKPDPKVEVCNNGKDDDGNGKTDCDDPDCAGQLGCPGGTTDGGNFGTCSRCGKAAASQSECLALDYQNDTPLPECVSGKCQRLNANVQVHFEVDTASLAGFPNALRALNTRIISKTAVDGSPVSCVTVRAAAMGKTEADAAQIEKPVDGGRPPFNLRGYDVSPLQATGGTIIKQPFVNVGTGSQFLIWTEVWGGPLGTTTKLPTGNRYTWGCFETGPEVAEVVPSDHCATSPDAGPCRTIKVKLVNGPE